MDMYSIITLERSHEFLTNCEVCAVRSWGNKKLKSKSFSHILDDILLSGRWLAGHVNQSRDTGAPPYSSNDIRICTDNSK